MSVGIVCVHPSEIIMIQVLIQITFMYCFNSKHINSPTEVNWTSQLLKIKCVGLQDWSLTYHSVQFGLHHPGCTMVPLLLSHHMHDNPCHAASWQMPSPEWRMGIWHTQIITLQEAIPHRQFFFLWPKTFWFFWLSSFSMKSKNFPPKQTLLAKLLLSQKPNFLSKHKLGGQVLISPSDS